MQMVAPPRCNSRINSMTASPLVGRVYPSARQQQDARLSTNRARNRDTLLLTAGQLAGQVLRAMRHADAFECRCGALFALSRAHPTIRQRQLNVFIDCEIADQVEALKPKSSESAVSTSSALFRIAAARVMNTHDVGRPITSPAALSVFVEALPDVPTKASSAVPSSFGGGGGGCACPAESFGEVRIRSVAAIPSRRCMRSGSPLGMSSLCLRVETRLTVRRRSDTISVSLSRGGAVR